MKEIEINKNEAGQRLDKLLAKYLNKAPKSFIYKMLRKKNINVGTFAKEHNLTKETPDAEIIRLVTELRGNGNG